MDKKSIISYIKENNGTEIPSLQKHFGISYREAKLIVDELVSAGKLVYDGGIKYNYVELQLKTEQKKDDGDTGRRINVPGQLRRFNRFEEFEQARLRKMRAEAANDDSDDDYDDDSDDDSDDEFDDYDDDSDGNLDNELEGFESEEDMLRYKAMKLCIENNTVAVSMLQRFLSISYVRACRLIDWMETMGFVSMTIGRGPRRVLISQKELDYFFDKTKKTDSEDSTSST